MFSNHGRAAIIAALGLTISGCVSFKFDYSPPTEGPIASVRISSSLADNYNQRVYFHGMDPCDPNQAKLIGLLHAKAIGQTDVSELNVAVPARQQIRVSIPLQDVVRFGYPTITMSYCQPMLVFAPEPNKRYEVEFGMCSARLFELIDGTRTPSSLGKADESCKISTTNRGNVNNGNIFFLKPLDAK